MNETSDGAEDHLWDDPSDEGSCEDGVVADPRIFAFYGNPRVFNFDGYYDRFFVLERRARGLADNDDAPTTGTPADSETEGLPCKGASTTPAAQSSSKITAAAGGRASNLSAHSGRRVRDAASSAQRKAARAAAYTTVAPSDGETEGLPCEGASTTPAAQISSKITAAAGGRASNLSAHSGRRVRDAASSARRRAARAAASKTGAPSDGETEGLPCKGASTTPAAQISSKITAAAGGRASNLDRTAHHDEGGGVSETESDDKTDAGWEPASTTRGAVPQFARDATFAPPASSAPASAVTITVMGTGNGVRADARSGQQVTFAGGPGDRRADLGRD